MIVPDSVRKEWTTPPGEFEILSEDLQTIRIQLEEELQTTQTQLETTQTQLETTQTQLETIRTQLGDLQTMRAQLEETRTELSAEKMKTYQLQKRLELLEMSQAALINRIENL